MLNKIIHRENRFIRNEKIAFIIMPLFLIPVLFEFYFLDFKSQWFYSHYDTMLFINIAYIVIVRFAFLDTAIYIFSRSKAHIHLTLLQIVLLYLEVTLITIIYYASIYYMFDVFSLFHLNSQFTAQNLKIIHEHSFIVSMYISAVTFTTLGSGDWIPQTPPAMVAVISEAILGVIQGGVFVAIIIYAHQNKKV